MKNIIKINKKGINLSSFSKIDELNKAYTEGIYSDTPANRKLGRVGMTYTAYAEKVKKESGDKKEDSNKDTKTSENLPEMDYKIETISSKFPIVFIKNSSKDKDAKIRLSTKNNDRNVIINIPKEEMKTLLENVANQKSMEIKLSIKDNLKDNYEKESDYKSMILSYSSYKDEITFTKETSDGDNITEKFDSSVFNKVISDLKNNKTSSSNKEIKSREDLKSFITNNKFEGIKNIYLTKIDNKEGVSFEYQNDRGRHKMYFLISDNKIEYTFLSTGKFDNPIKGEINSNNISEVFNSNFVKDLQDKVMKNRDKIVGSIYSRNF